jgi:predicted DNA-binding protein with PD1-like motif
MGVDVSMNVQPIKAGRDGMQVLIFATGDEVMATLREYAIKQGIQAARLTGIGAFQSATLAYFDWETKAYEEIVVDEQVEVLVLAGDIAMKDGKPEPHVHVVLGRRDGSTRGGHLCRAVVRPTLELMLEAGGALVRRFDPASGLALIAPET